MTFIIRDRAPVPELDSEIARLRELLKDLEKVRSGQHPDQDALSESPLLQDWEVTVRPELCLTGIVHGHTRIKDSRAAITTELWLFAPQLGYARTLSRFYALGAPAILRKRRH
uniref:Uncharacterized protein n=1 Tax=Rhodopseudomonas palustris (strain BisA53) TaxID=316055 RepID=Q07NV5_RHOP5